MASEERIVLRLDHSVAFERHLAAEYRLKSRSRRQEWIRLVLRVGFEALSGRASPAVSVLAANEPRPHAPAASGLRDQRETLPGASENTAADASQIKGLFGDQQVSPT
jgi:hypothetical protein